jgi:hypothetical protein
VHPVPDPLNFFFFLLVPGIEPGPPDLPIINTIPKIRGLNLNGTF